jgi:thiol-disulfide isomerase/thioredoxin
MKRLFNNIVYKRLIRFGFSALLLAAFCFTSCDKPLPEAGLNEGIWRGEILAQDNEIPFNFNVNKAEGIYSITLINGDEELEIDDVNIIGDSLFFNMHIFDISIRAEMNGDTLSGTYTKNYAEDYVLPFNAVHGKKGRFDEVSSSNNFDGTWETTFYTQEGKETPAVGVFYAEEGVLKGTFLTKTGDYRFLDGYTEKDTMHLFTFDGNHIYKFKAFKESDSILKGEYWSGKTSYKTFVSKRNDTASLPDANTLTYLKEGYDRVEFTFPDLNGKEVSLTDEKYKDKVVILQIFGTWCPNCMDETRFLADWYRKNSDKGVEIIGLAYEIKPDFDYARERVLTMKEKLDVPYDFLIAGTSSTESASESLPMLNRVMSFPTSIIIDRKGEVRRIHTGFSGPATGVYYEEFVDDFNQFMKEVIDEPGA